VPVWGHHDEADPLSMARSIDAAADHGVGAFIFDWYWYDDGSFLARALDEGFLGSANSGRLKFALMWANHDWTDIHPARRGDTGRNARCLYPGAVTRQTFDAMAEHIVARYVRHPSYWTIDGCPYVSIYDLAAFIRGVGGLEPARDALAHFRGKVRDAGFPDLHLNAVVWNTGLLPREEGLERPGDVIAHLGFKSFTSYVWVHHGVLREFPETGYADAHQRYLAYWERIVAEIGLPYHPNVTVGWDPTPRTVQSDVYENLGYPFTQVLKDYAPARFEAALAETKRRIEAGGGERILTINAWNEWTEGSYLEPDTVDGFGYLEAIRSVFGTR
jgi:hypothetical protein